MHLSILCTFMGILAKSSMEKQLGRALTVGAAQTCSCDGLTCNCCMSVEPQIANPGSVCFKTTYVPNDLALNVDVNVNGRSVYNTNIDPGNFPVCTPVFPPACFAFNRIHFDENGPQFCSEIRLGPVPIAKVPCISYRDGSLVASPNNY